MEGKPVSASSITLVQRMMAQDVNPSGNVPGGVILKLIDEAAFAVATRHARKNAVTASIDRVDFYTPVYAGDMLHIKASINLVGRTSMEIGVRVESENLLTGARHHTASAYLTYVALDRNGRPLLVPPLILETEEDQRRNGAAAVRRRIRLSQRSSSN